MRQVSSLQHYEYQTIWEEKMWKIHVNMWSSVAKFFNSQSVHLTQLKMTIYDMSVKYF